MFVDSSADYRSMRPKGRARPLWWAGGLLLVVVVAVVCTSSMTVWKDQIAKFFNPGDGSELVRLPMGLVNGTRAILVGYQSPEYGRSFKGIQYAKAGRFEEPVALDLVEDVDAIEFKHTCMRPRGHYQEDMSEECLYLNVYTPLQVAGERMLSCPVAVWFHGGSYTMGAGSDSTPETVNSLVTEHRMIVVTINYRLGVFGFLGSDRLRGTDKSTGNYGTLDQQMALKWVKKHIKYFGGDTSRITVFGWSAGAASTSVHLSMPSNDGLFHQAAMMSGGFTGWAAQTLDDAEADYDLLVEKVGCHVHHECQARGPPCKCLLDVPAPELLEAELAVPVTWAPTVDGAALPLHPIDALKQKKVLQGVPIIIGSAIEDALQDIGENATKDQFVQFLRTQVSGSAAIETATELYIGDDAVNSMMHSQETYHQGYSPAYWAARRVVSDKGMTCTARRSARQWREASGAEAFWYLWEEGSLPLYGAAKSGRRLRATEGQLKVSICWPCPGATHGSDLPFLFEVPSTNAVDALADLADTYHTFFANFFDLGDPNHWHHFQLWRGNQPAWPPAREGGGLSFAASNITADYEMRSRYCDFWDAQQT